MCFLEHNAISSGTLGMDASDEARLASAFVRNVKKGTFILYTTVHTTREKF